MCECGCAANDKHYRFPGPYRGTSFYLLTLSPSCTSCDAPAGIAIRHIKPGEFNHKWFSDPENVDGTLPLEMWGDGSAGVGIKTGMLRSEFIAATKSHLVGIDSKDFADEGKRKIDDDGADAIIEEMYDDAQFRPTLIAGWPAAMTSAGREPAESELKNGSDSEETAEVLPDVPALRKRLHAGEELGSNADPRVRGREVSRLAAGPAEFTERQTPAVEG